MPLGCPPSRCRYCRTFHVWLPCQLGSCRLTGEGEGASWSNRTSWSRGGGREAEGATQPWETNAGTRHQTALIRRAGQARTPASD